MVKILKNLFLQNHLAQMLEIVFVALSTCSLPKLFNEGFREQNGSAPGALGFEP